MNLPCCWIAGTIYTGVTTNLNRRVYEHREGVLDGFTRRYDVYLLVHYEVFEDIRDAIQREKNIKKWPRRWKLNLIEAENRDWRDLYQDFGA